ncbi:MAG: pantoate--beta-alanine ligase [Spirochaetes bacterium GWF1_41_5]|nr:MAG: pantoate--beta-alanine ligase [Spirochaetes bacterium GWF1_41_5]HBE01557.1 pantoate--beta-alanine ligase [Spirochaetia bacterium]
MNIYKEINNLYEFIREQKKKGRSAGLVPTMGALHEGHLTLIKRCRAENDICIVSIFVNPAQFGPNEDYTRYPRPLERDQNLLCGLADVLFLPEAGSFYLPEHCTWVNSDKNADILCGAYRPGHFQGVLTIVLKLFNVTMPDRAYFGKKDYQQYFLINSMCRDLNLPVSVIPCDLIRDSDGLAMSSRNIYLDPDQRKRALALSSALGHAQKLVRQGEINAGKILAAVENMLLEKNLKIDYTEIRNKLTLEACTKIDINSILLSAVYVDHIRLIDNIELAGMEKT